jgi:hypothetical protein
MLLHKLKAMKEAVQSPTKDNRVGIRLQEIAGRVDQVMDLKGRKRRYR